MPRTQTCISGISDLLALIRLREPDFNLSSFVRCALEVYIYGPEIEDPKRQIFEMVARETLEAKAKEQERQRRINDEIYRQIEARREYEMNAQLEEQRSKEEQERVSRIVTSALEATFGKELDKWYHRLPDHDVHGDYADMWVDVALQISEQTGTEVTPSECYAYVKSHKQEGDL